MIWRLWSRLLQPGDVACVLAEPVMTNVGHRASRAGISSGLRELTRKYGTLLIIDETHTICAGPGGYTRAEKSGAGLSGLWEADWRRSSRRGLWIHARKSPSAFGQQQNLEDCDTGGIGGTLAGNALSLAAMRATSDQGADQRSF